MASKNFVLDTNVLIENPKCVLALRNGQDNTIHIPYTVLTELDRLKRDPRLGHVVAAHLSASNNRPALAASALAAALGRLPREVLVASADEGCQWLNV